MRLRHTTDHHATGLPYSDSRILAPTSRPRRQTPIVTGRGKGVERGCRAGIRDATATAFVRESV